VALLAPEPGGRGTAGRGSAALPEFVARNSDLAIVAANRNGFARELVPLVQNDRAIDFVGDQPAGARARPAARCPGRAPRRPWHNPAMSDRPIKVLIAKPGLDGHDRGAKVLARGLRDEGFEVVYTGLRQTPEMIATAALQEDVDVVGLSILSGAHMTLLPRITKLLRDEGLDDVLVTAGGIIPDDDVTALAEVGVARVFGPGTTIAEVAEYLRTNARPRD
jgi:methylmalonyl-CoA mutase C-terminal domain/subunit